MKHRLIMKITQKKELQIFLQPFFLKAKESKNEVCFNAVMMPIKKFFIEQLFLCFDAFDQCLIKSVFSASRTSVGLI